MLVKILVFDGHRRFAQIPGDLLQSDRGPALVGKDVVQQLAVPIKNLGAKTLAPNHLIRPGQ